MTNTLIAFILAAGAATFVYTKLGRRIGYGNEQSVWKIVGITFVLSFAVVIIMLSTLVSLD